MDWYWVSYTIIDESTGGTSGAGSIEIQCQPPVNVQDVGALSERITRIGHENGALRRRSRVAVSAWSKFGSA